MGSARTVRPQQEAFRQKWHSAGRQFTAMKGGAGFVSLAPRGQALLEAFEWVEAEVGTLAIEGGDETRHSRASLLVVGTRGSSYLDCLVSLLPVRSGDSVQDSLIE